MEETKVCIGPCGKEKPATDFYLNATIGQPDRRRSECNNNLGWFEKYAAEIKKYLEAFDGYLA